MLDRGLNYDCWLMFDWTLYCIPTRIPSWLSKLYHATLFIRHIHAHLYVACEIYVIQLYSRQVFILFTYNSSLSLFIIVLIHTPLHCSCDMRICSSITDIANTTTCIISVFGMSGCVSALSISPNEGG